MAHCHGESLLLKALIHIKRQKKSGKDEFSMEITRTLD